MMHHGSGVAAPAERLPGRRRLRWARAASLVAAAVAGVVMPMLAYGLTGSVMVTALVAAVEGLPYLFLGPVAANLARRAARRPLLVGADLANAALLAGTAVVYGVDALPLPLLLGVAIGVQAAFVFVAAADSGDATRSETAGVARAVVLLVAALGGVAVAPVAPAFVLFVGSLALAVSGVLIGSAAGPAHDGASGSIAGQRDVWHRGLLRVPTLVDSALGFAAGVLVVQLALSMPWVLGWSLGEPAVGVVFAIWAVGGLAAVAAFPGAVRRLGGVRLSGLLMPVAALVMVGWALAGHPAIAAAAAAGWSVVGLTLVLNSIMLRHRVTPEALRRRAAMVARRFSLGVGWPLGAMAGGVVDKVAGPGPALMMAAVVLAAGALATWLPSVSGPDEPGRR